MGGCARLCRLLPGLLRRYWFLVVWTGACAGVFYVDYFRYKMLPQYYYTRRMLGLGLCVSRGSAAVLNLSCCFLVLPMCRALATTLAAALARPHRRPPALPATLPAPAAKTTHLVVAATVVISAVVHTGAHLSNAVNFSRYYSSHYPDLNLATYRGESPLRVFVATVPGITGAAMMIILAVLVITSTRWARRRNYDVFFYTHHLGLLFLLLLIIHPISGVLKEQKNLHGHIPGCHMYRDVHTKAEGFPEPSRAANYTNLDYNLKSQEKSRISYHVLEHNNQNQTSHTETMYPEPDSEYGYPEPDPHIGSPGPDSDYRYSEPGPEYGYPEPDPHIGSPGPDSDYHYSEPDSEYGYPEPDPHIGSPGPDSDYHYSEPDSEYGYPEPDPHIGSPASESENDYIGSDLDYSFHDSDSGYSNSEVGPHNKGSASESDSGYVKANSNYDYSEHSAAHNNFKSASNMKHPSTKLHTQRFVDKETSEESGRRTANWGEIRRSQKFSKKHRMCLKAPVFGSINSQTWIWVTVALAVWAADWAVRLWRRRESVHIISVVRYPCDVVQLTLRQSGFSCTPGQYVLVQCPAVSRFEWHPYTVTSPLTQHCPNTFTIFMRVRGDWSSRVAALLHPVRVSSPKSLNNHWAENEKHQCCSTSPQSSPATLSSPLIQSSQFSLSHINSLSPSFPHSNPHTNAMFSHLTQYTHAYSCMPTVDELKDCSFSPGEQKITEISYLKNQSIYPSNSKLNVKYDAHSGSNKVNLNLLNSHVPLLSANRHYKTSESRRLHPYSKHWMSQNSKSHRHSKLSNHCTSSGRTEDSCEKCMSNAEPNKQSADLQPNTRTSTFINAQPNSTLNSMKRSRSRKKWSHKSENGGLTKDKSCFSIFITEEPCVRLHVDGPFSSPSESMLHYPVVISAAGGVGITPLAATLSHILCCQSPLPERVHVVWVVRDARLFLALAPLLSSLLLHCWDAHTEDRLELRLHVTTPTPPQLLEDLFAKEHPSLLPRITQGRPVWKHLFREWQQVYIRDKVGVFACGPAKMRHQVRRHCLSSISRGAPFQYHQESFS